MPGIVRVNKDFHSGHASVTPNPFHRTSYAEGSGNVFINGEKAVRVTDKTACGDPAKDGSGNIFINGKKVHRHTDPTNGHGSWVPNSAASGSTNVFANGVITLGKIEELIDETTTYVPDPEEPTFEVTPPPPFSSNSPEEPSYESPPEFAIPPEVLVPVPEVPIPPGQSFLLSRSHAEVLRGNTFTITIRTSDERYFGLNTLFYVTGLEKEDFASRGFNGVTSPQKIEEGNPLHLEEGLLGTVKVNPLGEGTISFTIAGTPAEEKTFRLRLPYYEGTKYRTLDIFVLIKGEVGEIEDVINIEKYVSITSSAEVKRGLTGNYPAMYEGKTYTVTITTRNVMPGTTYIMRFEGSNLNIFDFANSNQTSRVSEPVEGILSLVQSNPNSNDAFMELKATTNENGVASFIVKPTADEKSEKTIHAYGEVLKIRMVSNNTHNFSNLAPGSSTQQLFYIVDDDIDTTFDFSGAYHYKPPYKPFNSPDVHRSGTFTFIDSKGNVLQDVNNSPATGKNINFTASQINTKLGSI